MNDEYCVFIISYKRAKNIKTIKALEKSNFSKKWFVVIGDDDPQKAEYKKIFGEKLLIFSKEKYLWVDLGDNLISDLKTPVFARNAVYDLAEALGYKYFFVLDDDYSNFYWMCFSDFSFTHKKIKNITPVFDALLKFYKSTPFSIVSVAQAGDFIGGESLFLDRIKNSFLLRKSMNVFLCSTMRRVEFLGRLNDDVNTYSYWGHRGVLFFTFFLVAVIQGLTQQNPGGITDNYLSYGTYYKSFFTILYCPSFSSISFIGNRFKRIHHKIFWENAVPFILRSNYL